jgi:hypothetical protein
MSELAFNLNGDPFDIPADAVGWRVRRMKAKGAPEVVYGRNGQPLVLPLEADIDDVRAEVGGSSGRYRFDPIDSANKPIEGAPAGYVFVHDLVPSPQSTAVQSTSLGTPSDNVVIEAMRMNSEIAKSVVDRFPQMLEAAAHLLRAADGAGLPAREPRALDEDDDEDEDETLDDESEPSAKGSSTFELINTLVAQIVPVIVTSLASKGMPKLGAVLDWRKAASAKPAKKAIDVDETDTTNEVAPPAAELPALDAAAMTKVMQIQAALTPAEQARARKLGAELSPTELREWFAELSDLDVPAAVVKVRSVIGGGQ